MGDINYDFIKNIYESVGKGNPSPKTPPPNSSSPKKPWGKIILVAFAIILAVFFGFAIAILSRFMLFETVLALLPGEKLIPKTNILILGLDKGVEIHRSDSILVVHLDPQGNKANILSVPRDTLVAVPGRGLDKINHSFAYGGAELTRQTVENFLKIKIPYYVTIDISGLEKMIDEIGGVRIDVEKRMFYVDYAQNLYVDLKPGMQTLNGRDSLSYLRYRHDREGDFGRITRQQKFVGALTKKMMQGGTFFSYPKLMLKFLSYLQTNLNTKEVLGFVLSMKKIYELGQIDMDSLRGNPISMDGVFYLQPVDSEVQEAVSKYFRQ